MTLFRTAARRLSWLTILCALFDAETPPSRKDGVVGLIDNGSYGFAGMFAGLLVVALATLGLRHRRHEDMQKRLKRTEAALEERDDKIWMLEEKLARALRLADAQGDILVREDAEGRVTHASEGLCLLLQKNSDEIVGVPLELDARGDVNPVVQDDGSITYDQEIMTPSGPRWIAWKEVAIVDDGKLIETQRSGHDITARIHWERALSDVSERAESASRAKSRFLAVVSHEVRTPLNGVLGMANLLLDSGLSPEQQTYAKSIKTSGDALLTLIEEILDFSKIEAGRLDLESVPFDLSNLVTDVVELLAPRAQGKGIEIAAEISDDIPARVFGDAVRLRQVLLNLAGNAVKFTDEGGVLVVVEREESGKIRFVVEDSGPGVGIEQQARIFQEFEQGDDSPARRHGGTGLGLAIASKIVERMGGEVSLQSAAERGSVFGFSVELPSAADAEPGFTPVDLSGRDILVASPSPVTGPALERKLSAWGANVTLAAEIAVAETLLPERDWSQVFVDRAFGAEAAVSLARSAKTQGRQLFVLLSPAERHELSKLRGAGFDGYLVKPLRAASLAAQLAAAEIEPVTVILENTEGPLPRERALAILIAEDNDINALLAQAMLGKLGHIPTVVGDGVAAVKAVASAHAVGAPFDLVLMDLHLPGMDGLEATRRIRALKGAGSVPVIALTANASAEDREACLAAGMDAFVVKPFDRETLDGAITNARGTSAKRAADAA